MNDSNVVTAYLINEGKTTEVPVYNDLNSRCYSCLKHRTGLTRNYSVSWAKLPADSTYERDIYETYGLSSGAASKIEVIEQNLGLLKITNAEFAIYQKVQKILTSQLARDVLCYHSKRLELEALEQKLSS